MVTRVSSRTRGRASKKLRLEREFLQAPNSLFEHLANTYLSPYESKVINFIIRKTFGWNKVEDWISLSQIEEATGIAKPNVSRTLNSLKRRNIIRRPNSKHLGLQPDYSLWLKDRSVTVI
jgi:phage replication O-like protein O